MRWQLLLAGTGFALVLALLSYHVQTGSQLCTERFPTSGGAYVEGLVGAPQSINPLLADDNPVDRELVALLFDGLTRYEDGELVPALAESWTVSEDGRTVRFTLRDDVTWHDGEPFTAADVAFTYGLLQDEAYPGPKALRSLWETVTIRVLAENEIEFELREPYAGFLEATTRGILPAHLLTGVTAETLADAPFNRTPIGTGPFRLAPGQDWQEQGAIALLPTTEAWPQGWRLGELRFQFFSSEEAVVDAFANGQIQAINNVTPAMLPQVAQLPGTRLFSAVAPRYSSLIFNMGDSGSAATQTLAVRQALVYALDRERLIDTTLSGQGVSLTGPYLPSSWAYNAGLLTPYATNPISATVALDEAGWSWPEGAEMRQNGDVPLLLRLLVFDTPTNRAIAQVLESSWKELGISPLTLLFSDWRDYRRSLADGEFDVALVDVAPPDDPDLYDFWSQEAIVRGQNFAGWNRRRASEALEDGRRLWSPAEREPFYDTFLRYYDEDLPEFTLFQHIVTYAVREDIEGIAIGRIDEPRDRYRSLPDWILAYEDLTVLCPETQP
jgi:peptide/nickel transport system substrate-binding protein